MQSLFPSITALLMMCSLILLRRAYSRLAKKHGKTSVGYALLGLLVYFAGCAVMGIVMGILSGKMGPDLIMLQLSAIWIFGCLCSVFLYFRLKRHWDAGDEKEEELLDR